MSDLKSDCCGAEVQAYAWKCDRFQAWRCAKCRQRCQPVAPTAEPKERGIWYIMNETNTEYRPATEAEAEKAEEWLKFREQYKHAQNAQKHASENSNGAARGWPSEEEVEEAHKAWAWSEQGDSFQGQGFRASVRWLRERMEGE